ncbi:MAG: Mini-ribonuclease 3 [Firmicutes bacterium]|nr:Mini-ribonuclease 3 [Bacillota bacterium]
MNGFLPKLSCVLSEKQARLLPPQVLSFVGDSVQTLFVRAELAVNTLGSAGTLHKKASAVINATSQAITLQKIRPHLTEDEENIFKRCRNSKGENHAKNASVTDYKTASGLEGLIGFLYLTGASERLGELLAHGNEPKENEE